MKDNGLYTRSAELYLKNLLSEKPMILKEEWGDQR